MGEDLELGDRDAGGSGAGGGIRIELGGVGGWVVLVWLIRLEQVE